MFTKYIHEDMIWGFCDLFRIRHVSVEAQALTQTGGELKRLENVGGYPGRVHVSC